MTSSLGGEVDTFYDALLAGQSGVSLIEGFDTGNYSTQARSVPPNPIHRCSQKLRHPKRA